MNEDNKPIDANFSDDWDGPTPDTDYRDSPWPFDESDNRVMLDWKTADRITICTLKFYLNSIYEREHDHKVNDAFYHDDDKEHDRKLKKALKRVLKYLGENDV